MAERVFAITRSDGGVSIMALWDDNATPQQEIAKWTAEDQASVVSVDQITRADIPADREFREAWEFN